IRPFPLNVQLSNTIGPDIPPPVAANHTLSPSTEQRSSNTWPPFGENSEGLEDPSCRAFRTTDTSCSVIRWPPMLTLFIVSSIRTWRIQQSSPFNLTAAYSCCVLV